MMTVRLRIITLCHAGVNINKKCTFSPFFFLLYVRNFTLTKTINNSTKVTRERILEIRVDVQYVQGTLCPERGNPIYFGSLVNMLKVRNAVRTP